MATGDGTHKHDWVGAYGQFWCRRCHAHLADAEEEAGCLVPPEPPPSVGSLLDRALGESVFDRLDRQFKGRRP